MRFFRKIALILALTAGFWILPVPAGADAQQPGEHEGVFLPVILYHAVTENPNKLGRDFISPGLFESDMAYLRDRGYTTVSVAEILNYVDNGVPLPEKPVLVTFDDGFYSVLYYLMPIIRRMGVKAVMNVEGSFAEQAAGENAGNPNWSYLTWGELRGLQDSGLFELGNHTYDMHHPNGARCGCKMASGESYEAYRQALLQDIGKLQDKLLETCGTLPAAFAYPFGCISKESYGVLEEMGFRILFTCYGTPNYLKTDPGKMLILHRYNRSGSLSTWSFMHRLLKG